MLTRIVLFGGLALFALKLFAPERLRAFGRQVDRAVNWTLLGLALVYAVDLAVWLLSK